MNDAQAPAFAPPTARELRQEFVDGAIERLASAVSGHLPAKAAAPGREQGSLARALGRVLAHFGRPVDELALALAARGDDVAAIVHRVCHQHDIHVREVELKPDESRSFAGPVLGFRGGDAVVLVPGMWRKWAVVGGAGMQHEPLQPRAFTFYRALPPEPTRMQALWRAVFVPENKRDLAYAVSWGFVAAAMSTVSVYLMRSLVEWALPEGDRGSLALLASGWCVVAFAASNLRLARSLLLTRVGTRVDVGTEAALVGKALSLPMSEFRGMGAGELSERIRDACTFGRAAYGTATDALLALFSAVAYGGMLMSTSWRAGIAVGAVVAVRAAVAALLLGQMYADGRAQAEARGKMSGLLFEMLSGVARIKVASAEARAFYRWATSFASVRSAGYRASLFSGLLTASEGLFDVAGTVALYALCCSSSPGEPAIGVGAFVVGTACLGGLQAACSEVVRGAARLLPMIPKAERVRPLLAAKAEVNPAAGAAMLEGNVSLRHVTFHYAEDDVRVLDNVSVDIRKGEFVAVVGPSGCGKSTLIKMILGFYAPTAGSILLDGKDLANLDLRSVRGQIGAVLQGSELLPSSILFNIVGTSRKTMDDAWRAAERACIAEDIAHMPMKMFTELSDRAVTISGGQKQRILIARALVREPKLVIFDEATSALDNKTQAGVMAALSKLTCTKICIAHRLSTVVHADRILVMNKGTVVQQGTYESLMREGGLFRTLVETQLESERTNAGR